ncbi:glycerophosphodiester phosphodiesterase [Sungkyunkwania multivorans]|uniref:Glycerophosphodiester phosphodiesterase n=1 Tax=Sungkyunkwania multivorans TaxID=1173618 RepID=A0ABW3D0C8_9FLAO
MKTTPLNIGHRGARGHVAENTVASVKKAMELGVDGVEIDVFKCASGEIVVIHDTTLDRTTNGTGYVMDHTYFQLKQLKVEGEYTIPLLQDVLKALDKKVKLNVELKGPGTADRVAFILNYYIEKQGWNPKDFIVSSFDWDELRSFYQLNKEIPIGILTEDDPLDAIDVAKELNAFSIHPNHRFLTKGNVKAIQSEGYKIYTWTVNDPADIQRMRALGVEAIITDYPERLRE